MFEDARVFRFHLPNSGPGTIVPAPRRFSGAGQRSGSRRSPASMGAKTGHSVGISVFFRLSRPGCPATHFRLCGRCTGLSAEGPRPAGVARRRRRADSAPRSGPRACCPGRSGRCMTVSYDWSATEAPPARMLQPADHRPKFIFGFPRLPAPMMTPPRWRRLS